MGPQDAASYSYLAPLAWVVGYLLLVNLAAFITYGVDKKRAQKGAWRVPEAVLMAFSLAGGAIGSFAAMHFFHHKTRKPKFYIGVPAILLLQVAFALLLPGLLFGR